MTEQLARQELATLMNERNALKREHDTLVERANRLEYAYYCSHESDKDLLEEWLYTREKADEIWSESRRNFARQCELRRYLERFRDPNRAYV